MHAFLFCILAIVAVVAFLVWIPAAAISALSRAIVRFTMEESR